MINASDLFGGGDIFVVPGDSVSTVNLGTETVTNLIDPESNTNGIDITSLVSSVVRGECVIEIGNDTSGWSLLVSASPERTEQANAISLQNIHLPADTGLRVYGYGSFGSTTTVTIRFHLR